MHNRRKGSVDYLTYRVITRKRASDELGSMSDAARAIGYDTRPGIVYVLDVLRGTKISRPILDRINEHLDSRSG